MTLNHHGPMPPFKVFMNTRRKERRKPGCKTEKGFFFFIRAHMKYYIQFWIYFRERGRYWINPRSCLRGDELAVIDSIHTEARGTVF